MKYIISEAQYRLLIEQSNNPSLASSYPSCVGRETSNKNRAEILKTDSGQYFLKLYIKGFQDYQFYSNGRVMKPDGKMANYTCGGTNNLDILIDGVDVAGEKWNREKSKYVTNYEKQEINKATTLLNNLSNIDPHTALTILQIGTAFIPIAGPFISAGIGLVDAGLYYKENQKGSAAVSAIFSLLPFVGKIPGVKEAGSKIWSTLASKLSSGAKLSQAEISLVNQVASNAPAVQTALKNASEKLSPFLKQIQNLKPSYIDRYGQEAYEKLVREFVSGVSDQNYFLQALKSGGKASPNLANFISKFGIKFDRDEILQIQKIATQVLDDTTVKNVVLNSKSGPRVVKVYTVPKSAVQLKLPASANATMFADAAGDAVYVVKDNAELLNGKALEDILTHEFAHIKDPSVVKSPVYIKKYDTEAVQGMKDFAAANEIFYSGENFDEAKKLFDRGVKNYYLNPNEVIANNAMVLQQFTTNAVNLQNVMTKQEILKGLDDIIEFTKGNSARWSEDASKLLGYYDAGISNHFTLLSHDPKKYINFLSLVAQQANYLKSQIKIAMY